MTFNPYKIQPTKAFWSKSVTNNYEPSEIIFADKPLLKKKDKVTSAGSCFASNLVPYIESAGLTYIRTEQIPKVFEELGENLGYANFSAAYGNVYTSRQLLQLYLRSLGKFQPAEDRWQIRDTFIDPFRPGFKFPAKSSEEFDLLTKSHLAATQKAFETADVFVFTFGLTEAWVHNADGATYPACPGTIAGDFDEKKYIFKNFTVSEIVSDMSIFIETLRHVNPGVRFIFSVSPVPLVATATKNHVLSASIYSKSVLRVAAEELVNNFKNVDYFPAFEIITGPQAPKNFFESDRRNVSQLGVETVMAALLSSSGLRSQLIVKEQKNNLENEIESLSRKVAQADCDEVMLDESLNSQNS